MKRTIILPIITILFLVTFVTFGGCLTTIHSSPQPQAPAFASDEPGASPPSQLTTTPQTPRQLSVEIITIYPHDPDAFTQGLLFHEGRLLESTGNYGKSSLREVDLVTGGILRETAISDELFGEGITVIGDSLYQLTYRENTAIVWDLDTFDESGRFLYLGEGWGLASDGEYLIMTDGSSTLFFREPSTFDLCFTRQVTKEGIPQARLNELEFADGMLWANIFEEDKIVCIDHKTGEIQAVVNCSGLRNYQNRQITDIMNGIAWREETETFLITGKFWPEIFEVRFIPAN